MAKTLDERLEDLYNRRDNVGQQFNADDIKTFVEGIRDAREKGGTPIKGATATELQPDETPTAEMTSDGTLVLGIPKGQKGDDGKQGDPGEQGKSAYQVWLEEGNEGTEADFFNSLKAHVSRFIPIATVADATSLDVGDTYAFSDVPSPTDGAMLLMPNGDTTTPKTLMFSVTSNGDTPETFTYTYVGELSISTEGFLSTDKIVQNLNAGGADKVPSAEAVKGLNIEVNGDLVVLSDIMSNATEVVADITSNSWDGSPVSGNKRAGRLSIKDEYKQIRVVGNGTTNTYFFFSTEAIPSNTDLTLTQLNDYFCSDDQAIHIAYSTIRLVVPIGAKYLYYSKKDSGNITRTPTAIIPIVNDGNGLVDKIPDYNSVTVFTVSGGVGISNSKVQITDNAARRHCPRFFVTSELERVAVADGYLVMVVYFDDNLQKYDQSQYAQEVKIEKKYKYALFGVKKSSDADFSEEDDAQLTLYSFGATIYDLSKQTCEGVELDALFSTNLLINNKLINQTTLWTNYDSSNVGYDANSLSFNKSFNAGPNHNLIYQSVNLKEGHKYLIACESKVESVDSTKFKDANNKPLNMLDMRSDKTGVNNVRILGLYIYGQSGASGFATPFDKYRIALRTFDVPVSTEVGTVIAKNISFGNIGPAAAIEGYVRNPVLIDLTELGLATVKRGELFKAYRDYANYFICQSVSDYNASLGEPIKVEYADCEARSAFVEEMNNIASELGCADSVFCNPSGVYTADHLVTCKDFLKIGAAAMTENAFLRIINTHEMDVPVVHSNGNAGVITNVVAKYSGVENLKWNEATQSYINIGSDVLLSNYDIVAAKTGSWDADGNDNDTQTLVMVVRSHATGNFIVGYIHHGGSVSTVWNDAKYNYIKSLFDKVEDETTVLNVGTTTNYSAGYISSITQWAKYVDWGTVKLLDTAAFPPASTTKYLSCMIVLQHLQVDEIVEYVAADWSSGSGAAVTAGDKFKVRDAVFCCMASSSNSLANMLARWCGYRLLEEQNK